MKPCLSIAGLRPGLELVLLIALATSFGCYSRVELVPKSTPPAAKIAMAFEVSEDLLAMPSRVESQLKALDNGAQDAPAVAQQLEAASAGLAQMGANLQNQLKADLLRTNLGFPVADADAGADLLLSGTFRSTPYNGVALDWQLVEVQSGAVVRAGVAERSFMSFDVAPFADEILQDLLAMDIDVYAGSEGGRPTAPVAAGTPADATPASGTDGSKSFAVIIGIEKYRDELPEATFAEADAKAFAAFAEKTLGVPAAHIKLLVGERAGRADIASVIEEWLPKNAVQAGGRVYVFFSGHGAPDTESGDAFLVPYDADPTYIKTRGYSVDALYGELGKLKGQQSLVFLDACFSGSGDRSVLAKGTRPLVPIKEPAARGGVIAFAAASAKQTTGAADKGGHGLFSAHLLTGLAGAADANGDHDVTLAELVAHVSEKVSTEARLQNREQTPTLQAPKGVDPSLLNVVDDLAP